MSETLEQLVARINASAYLPPPEPTGAVMAQKVKLAKGKEFDFGKAAKATGSKYPWDEWFSGDLLLLERSDVDGDGELVPGGDKRDFEVERDAMPGKLKSAARRRYKVVQISKRDADGQPLPHDGLIIKARDMTAEERQAEDLLRAEEREARKAKKDGGPADDQPAAE